MSENHITKAEVEHVAKLSRLPLTDAEAERYTSELQSILGYFQVLSGVNTEDTKETAQVTGQQNIMREDVVVQQSPEVITALVACGPHGIQDGCIKIPNIM